jgi:hypothetical protein
LAGNAKVAKSDWVGKVLRTEPSMYNDFNKSTKGYKNSIRLEIAKKQGKVVHEERGCCNYCSNNYVMACWTTIHSTRKWNAYAFMSMLVMQY